MVGNLNFKLILGIWKVFYSGKKWVCVLIRECMLNRMNMVRRIAVDNLFQHLGSSCGKIISGIYKHDVLVFHLDHL